MRPQPRPRSGGLSQSPFSKMSIPRFLLGGRTPTTPPHPTSLTPRSSPHVPHPTSLTPRPSPHVPHPTSLTPRPSPHVPQRTHDATWANFISIFNVNEDDSQLSSSAFLHYAEGPERTQHPPDPPLLSLWKRGCGKVLAFCAHDKPLGLADILGHYAPPVIVCARQSTGILSAQTNPMQI